MQTRIMESKLGTTTVNWNISARHEPRLELVGMGADIALLQEVGSGDALNTLAKGWVLWTVRYLLVLLEWYARSIF